jgi:hypothetical protein
MSIGSGRGAGIGALVLRGPVLDPVDPVIE